MWSSGDAEPVLKEAHLKTLKEIYGLRFSEREDAEKDAVWREVCRFLQRFVPRDAAVVDIAADRGYFIRNIDAAEKWATDLRPMQPFLPREVRFVEANSMDLRDHLPLAHFDIAFISNFLEHLPTSEAVVEQLAVVHDLLKPGGRLIVLQPNIRLVGGQYWDFIDHQVGLTEKSLQEAAELAGLATSELITRFVPYTTKSRYPRHPFLVRAYLQLPFLWLILGKQSLYIGERQRATTIRPEASEL